MLSVLEDFFSLLDWVVGGPMALVVGRGLLVGIMPPLIVFGVSVVACCMCKP